MKHADGLKTHGNMDGTYSVSGTVWVLFSVLTECCTDCFLVRFLGYFCFA